MAYDDSRLDDIAEKLTGEKTSKGKRKSSGSEDKPKKIDPENPDGSKKSQATILIELAGGHEVFHDPDQTAYVLIVEGGVRRVLPVRSQDFKRWLAGQFFTVTGKGCNNNAIADALNTIEAKALHQGETRPVYLRVANLRDRIYLDLCDDLWRVIEIDGAGWRILEQSPVCFVRKRGMLPLPIPEAGGGVELLRPFLNIRSDDFPLVIGWLLGSLRGKGPFPVLVFQGEQGTGKSTTSRVLRSFVDPSSVPLRSPPREVRDLLVSAINNWLPCIDNLSGLAPEFSDALCRLSTGGGLDARALYSDTDQVLIDIQRPVLVNGIDDIATRPDLSERSIIINLPVIDPSQRRQESRFWVEFEAARPLIFGALLDALACACRIAPSVHLSRLPRMADFAVWATAAESSLDWRAGSFMSAYERNQGAAIEAGIEASPVGSTLLTLLDGLTEWTETPSELLTTLTERAGLLAKSKAWPQSPKGLKNTLNRLAPGLRRIGITFTQEQGHGRRYTFIQAPKQPPDPPIRPSTDTKPSNGAGFVEVAHGADSGAVGADKCPSGADNRPLGADSDLQPPKRKPSHGAGFGDSSGTSGGWGGYSGPSVTADAEVF